MGVSKTSFDIAKLSATLMQLGEKSERTILFVMREEAEKLKEEAQANAPVDGGDLVNAIEVVESRTGINNRTEVSVQVNPNNLDDLGRPIGKYAMIMHEMLEPFGSGRFNLGPESVIKTQGNGGKVGGKYMERAIRSRVGVIAKRIKQVAEGIFR